MQQLLICCSFGSVVIVDIQDNGLNMIGYPKVLLLLYYYTVILLSVLDAD